eukprot:gene24578-30944_t
MNVLHAIDFDVLVLLASIMIVNHIVVHLKETKKVIVYLQTLVQENPEGGFWMIALASFALSPFLTNDGVCLLFVEPILNAFENTIRIDEEMENGGSLTATNKSKLQTADAVYFLLALACSSNIGSALTYTGNPQNMIVATDSIGVMPSYKFLIYMLLPSLFAWLVTMKWIQRCWRLNREQIEAAAVQNMLLCGADPEANNADSTELTVETSRVPFPRFNIPWCGCDEPGVTSPYSMSGKGSLAGTRSPLSPTRRRARASDSNKGMKRVVRVVTSPFPYMVLILLALMIIMIFVDVMPISGLICVSAIVMVLCVVVGNHWRNQKVWDEVSQDEDRAVEPLLAGSQHGAVPHRRSHSRLSGSYAPAHKSHPSTGFADTEDAGMQRHTTVSGSNKHKHSRSASSDLVKVSHHPSISREMISTSHKDAATVSAQPRGQYSVLAASGMQNNSDKLAIVTSGSGDLPDAVSTQQEELTREEKTDNLNEFFEGLFGSIDYSLLLIFMGTFIVVENMASTGIPKFIWDKIVGRVPFSTFGSVVGISLFVLVSSQLLGNVAVIQLAKPNIESLDDNAKRYAWAVLSFVATVGGNLTVTGSAANIIVVEKAARLDANMSIDFFRHFHVCFWVTLFCCAVGGGLVSLIVQTDNANGSHW